ncbi:hypothetical protein GCM10023063_44440 [Arthrobacter methylotrophus]
MPLLARLDKITDLPVRKPRPARYEHDHPGDLVHVDVKKLGRIPDGGGHRVQGRTAGNRNNKKQGRGYAYLHHAVDDHSRYAYSEIPTDEKQHTAAAFWVRANAAFQAEGITVLRVLTDNGSCYRSKVFNDALGPGIKHKYTRPYRPQTNGKVERFNRTPAFEWADARAYSSDEARAAAHQEWLTTTSTIDPTTALKATHPSSAFTTSVRVTTSAPEIVGAGYPGLWSAMARS